MTEADWLTTKNLDALLNELRRRRFDRAVGLWIVACARLVEPLYSQPDIAKAINAAERYVDGKVVRGTLERWNQRVKKVGDNAVWTALWYLGFDRYHYHPGRVVGELTFAARKKASPAQLHKPEQAEWACIRSLLRDVAGNPFQARPAFDAAWRTGSVKRMAEGIYAARRFDELPILADALEDAGCADVELLDHLRGPGPHDRGCWALDVVLGKGPP